MKLHIKVYIRKYYRTRNHSLCVWLGSCTGHGDSEFPGAVPDPETVSLVQCPPPPALYETTLCDALGSSLHHPTVDSSVMELHLVYTI